jgi:hypothetical protein
MVNAMYFQFLKRTFHRLLITGLTYLLKISRTRWVKAVISWLFGIIWKQKILHKIKQNTIAKKYRYIGIIGIFFPVSFFFKYRNSLGEYTLNLMFATSCNVIVSALIIDRLFHFQHAIPVYHYKNTGLQKLIHNRKKCL